MWLERNSAIKGASKETAETCNERGHWKLQLLEWGVDNTGTPLPVDFRWHLVWHLPVSFLRSMEKLLTGLVLLVSPFFFFFSFLFCLSTKR